MFVDGEAVEMIVDILLLGIRIFRLRVGGSLIRRRDDRNCRGYFDFRSRKNQGSPHIFEDWKQVNIVVEKLSAR